MPEVDASVIIPTHRGARRLPDLLDALVAQTYDGAWEVVVSLDGVVDETPAVLERYRERLPLVVLTNSDPRNVCAALNDGYARARGKVLIRCDDDLTPAPDHARAACRLASRTGAGRRVLPDARRLRRHPLRPGVWTAGQPPASGGVVLPARG